MAGSNNGGTPSRLPQNPKYVALETIATILVIVGAILAYRHVAMALVAVVFVAAAIFFLVSALMNIRAIKAQQAQMEQLKSEKKVPKDENSSKGE